MASKTSIDDIAAMIEDCEKRESKLDDWEREFIDNVSRRESLTDSQVESLEKIWNRVTA